MRLDKFVCKSTLLDKAEASLRIQQGEVTVNGHPVTIGATQVHENNEVQWLGERLTPRPFRYLMMHKPAGTVCSNIDEVYPSVFRHLDIEHPDELHIVGRLDADTTGLILLTDDGRWSFHITQPNSGCGKRYRVRLAKPIAEDAAEQFKQGVLLQGENSPTRPAQLDIVSAYTVLLTLTEGKFHQVKRMLAAVGNRVVGLHRESIGPLSLDVPECGWRYLTDEEVRSLMKPA